MTAILIVIYQNKKISKQKDDINDLSNNVEYYQDALSNVNNIVKENTILKLTIDDINNSNDIIIKSLDKTRDSLDISNKRLKDMSSITTIINDTIEIEIENNNMDCDFSVNKILNSQSSIEIIRVDTLLKIIPHIENTQSLFVYEKKEYKNKRKNWFDRLIHLDYKKRNVDSYVIENSNDLIKVVDVRVIKIKN